MTLTFRGAMRPLSLACALAAAAPLAAHAQETAPVQSAPAPAAAERVQPPAPVDQWSWGFSVGTATLKEDFAYDNFLGDSVLDINFDFEYRPMPQVALTGTLGYSDFEDDLEFSQDVCYEYGGGCSTESSGSSSVTLGIGVRGDLPVGDMLILSGGAGYRYLNHGRTIANCSNCFDGPDVTIDSFYVAPGASVRVAPTTWINVRYQHYLDGAFDGGEFLAGMTFSR